MQKIDPESKIMQAMTFLADVILLSLLFVLTSLPIVTIGASATALYSVFRRHQKETTSVVAAFFRAFSANWKPATLSWLIQLVLTALLVWDLWYLQLSGSGLSAVLRVAAIVLLVVLTTAASLVYPQIARYENKLGRYWKNALLLCFPKLWLLFLNLLLFFLPEALLLFRPDIYRYLLALRVMLLFGFQFYISSLLMERLFLTLEAGGR